MQITGAVLREQGVSFAVVIVKPQVVQNSVEAMSAIASFTPVFRVPVLLMAQDAGGRPTYFGRNDLARFMSRVPLSAVPWRKYTIN